MLFASDHADSVDLPLRSLVYGFLCTKLEKVVRMMLVLGES